jgi:hypothetical protein
MSFIFNPPIGLIDPCNDPNLQGNPITGMSKSADQSGVFGIHCAGGDGVQGHSSSGTGVRGQSSSGVAVRGDSDTFHGVFGRSNHHDGIHGRSAAPNHAGVAAVNETNGIGLFAQSSGGQAGAFAGNVGITGDLSVTGNINCPRTTVTCFDVVISNGDCAEEFALACPEVPLPGTVMCLVADGGVRPSESPYDTSVAGVISGARDFKPGILLDRQPGSGRRVPLALVGKVFCRVNADNAPIEVGDLLTTSAIPGTAMKAVDPQRAFGAVIGKALKPLATGEGLIPILIALT